MADNPPVRIGVRLAQTVGITTTAFLAGQLAGISFLTIPAIMEAPSPLAVKQYQKVRNNSLPYTPLLVVVSSALFGYLGYHKCKLPAWLGWTCLHPRLFITAAVFVFSIIPYSILTVEPVDHKLENKAETLSTASLTDNSTEAGIHYQDTVKGLLDRFATMNLGRAAIAFAAAAMGTWGAIAHHHSAHLTSVGSLHFATGANRMGH
ncbi:hypothetical protein M501DRAFT_1046966 [Patellaria atrata CBS 101060]|uniref:DUF1772-domain-containing protein n=1 Tax=Patellaria atrata CBS 101060 TaxID=1346257 RepID=A0A9P4S3J5_9PEZI|nr:hypothetical protein M501DRAFT_1046966 [Patellaria atrata CBS 101060]